MKDIEDVKELIKHHEGYSDKIYYDSVKVLTGGYGHAFLVNSELPEHIWNLIFDHDFKQAVIDFYNLKILGLDHVRKAAIISMCYQLGLTKVLKFKKFLAAVKDEDWVRASNEMLNSKWAEQTPNRVRDLSIMILTGDVE